MECKNILQQTFPDLTLFVLLFLFVSIFLKFAVTFCVPVLKTADSMPLDFEICSINKNIVVILKGPQV